MQGKVAGSGERVQLLECDGGSGITNVLFFLQPVDVRRRHSSGPAT